jgi:hypothetical protein
LRFITLDEEPVATQLLIYVNAVPITQSRHGQWSVEVVGDYAFAAKVNSLPLMAVEMPQAAMEYPIVFAGDAQAVMPAVVLGLREAENLYLMADGQWRAKYVPAFLRRYPFVFSTSEDGGTFTLCIDEAFPGFNREGRGARLFGEDGKPTAYVENVLKFLQEYQAQFRLTQSFCTKLKTLDLLEPMQAHMTLQSGQRAALTGFMTVSRERLKKLSGGAFADLARTDELELVYLHLHSLRNFAALSERMGAKQAKAA